MKIYGIEALKAFANQQSDEVRDALIERAERARMTRENIEELGLNIFDGVCDLISAYYVEKGLIVYCHEYIVHRGYKLLVLNLTGGMEFRFALADSIKTDGRFESKAKAPERVKVPTIEIMDEWLGYLLEVEREKEEYIIRSISKS